VPNGYYIYGWFYLATGQCFYIGKGKGGRYRETKGRSALFQQIMSMHPIAPRILVEGLSEPQAVQLEKTTIESLLLFRYPLINQLLGERSATAQAEGIAEAKKAGKYKGRKPIEVDQTKFKVLYPEWKAGKMTAVQMQKALGITAPTFYRRVKKYEGRA